MWLMQEAGPSQDEVSTVHTLLQRAFETQQHENTYWHEQLMGGYQSRSYQTVRTPHLQRRIIWLGDGMGSGLPDCTRLTLVLMPLAVLDLACLASDTS